MSFMDAPYVEVCSLVCPINLLAETIDGRIPCVCLWWELICQRCHPLEQRYDITAVKIDSRATIQVLQIFDLERRPVLPLAKRQIRGGRPLAFPGATPRGRTGDAWLHHRGPRRRWRPQNAAMIHEATHHRRVLPNPWTTKLTWTVELFVNFQNTVFLQIFQIPSIG